MSSQKGIIMYFKINRTGFHSIVRERKKYLLVIGGLLLAFLGGGPADAGEFKTRANRPSLPVLRPDQRVLVDIARAGERLVAVGERGLIVLSDDGGDHWRQAIAPVSFTLTAVDFTCAKKGWVTGHGGVILHTEDGGQTWKIQLDGNTAARIELESATAAADRAGKKKTDRLSKAEYLVKEGGDKPFLDVKFLTEKTGFACGAFGLFFGTQDGGKTWQSCMDRVDNPDEMHLFAVDFLEGQSLWIAGEGGFLALSPDRGKSFTRMDSPSAASFFAVKVSASGGVYLGGLQGNNFWSGDQGKTFQKIKNSENCTVNGVAATDDGAIVFVTAKGGMCNFDLAACIASPMQIRPNAGLSAVTQGASMGSLVAVGTAGILKTSGQTLKSQ